MKQKRTKLFIAMIMTIIMSSSVVTLAGTVYTNSKVIKSSKYKYAVGVYVEYQPKVGLDRGYFHLAMAGEDKDKTYVDYDVYKRYGTSNNWEYKVYFDGSLGCYRNGVGDTCFTYCASGEKRFTDAESFRVRVTVDGKKNYIAATNKNY